MLLLYGYKHLDTDVWTTQRCILLPDFQLINVHEDLCKLAPLVLGNIYIFSEKQGEERRREVVATCKHPSCLCLAPHTLLWLVAT